MLGVLLGTMITLVCSVVRLKLELEEAERLLDDPSIRFPNQERPAREYERADQPLYDLLKEKKKHQKYHFIIIIIMNKGIYNNYM